MSKTVINKREQIKWNNGFDPNGKSIPDITAEDEGKILKVEEGVLVFGEDAGAVLPSYSSSDEGKVLKVDSNGDLEWGTDEGTTYTAGDNIQISSENVISATDTTYTAGDNVQISSENVISATNTTYTAGTNISISAQNEISATDTTYSAGTGISIDGSNVISADNQLPSVSSSDEGKVLKVDANGDWAVGTDNDTTYTAGTNVQINGNVISATDTTYSAGTGITITGTSISADSQLPSYSSSENGKVLSVDSNGDLEWSTPSEDIVTFNFDETTSGSGVYELKNGKTSDDVVSAIASGKAVYLIQGSIATVAQVYTLRSYIPNTTVAFTNAGHNTTAGTVTVNQASIMLILGTTTSVTLESQTVSKELPSYSSSDNGKVLSVDSNGDLQWTKLYRDLAGTLAAGQTTITVVSPSITTTATYDYYTDVYGVVPTAVTISTGSMVLTFEAQQSDLHVKVRVW